MTDKNLEHVSSQSGGTRVVSNEVEKLNFFEKVVEVVAKYGKSTVLFSVLIFFLVINLIVNPINLERILEKWYDKAELMHRIGLEKRQTADLAIPPMMDNVLYRVNASRVIILEFHNSGMNNSNLPFYHFRATYETIDENDHSLEYVRDQYQNQGTGDYAQIIDRLKRNRYIFYGDIDTIDVPDKAIKRMKLNGVRCAYMTAIYSNNGIMIGVLVITTTRPFGLDEKLIDDVVLRNVQQFGHLLTGVI